MNGRCLPPGVSLCPRNTNRPYRARIQRNGRRRLLGDFATVDEAAAVYRRALASGTTALDSRLERNGGHRGWHKSLSGVTGTER
jgi:hypothetical protein